LGLSLAQGIARLHNGKLLLKDNAPGLLVELVLPRPDASR
jgi:signal transduction histidine kinase